MNVCDEKLHAGIELITDEDMETLEQEMKQVAPHKFSEEFEKKMDTLIKDQMPRKKKRTYSRPRYVAAAAAAVVVIGGFGLTGGAKLYASETNIPILKWMENFFVTEHDTDQVKGENSNEVLFDQAQIGYLPEGFELVEASVLGSKSSYIYQDEENHRIVLEVWKDKISSGMDNAETGKGMDINEAGLEYRYIYKTDSCKHVFEWLDKSSKCYILSGDIAKAELEQVMNGISY